MNEREGIDVIKCVTGTYVLVQISPFICKMNS